MIRQREYLLGFDDSGEAVILNLDGSPCTEADLQFLFDVQGSYRERHFPDQNDKQPKKGYVYLIVGIDASGVRNCKIGKSKDVQSRHRQLGIKMPFPIEVEHYIECADMHCIERYWHHMFQGKRLEGEWFNLTDEDISLFCSKQTMDLTAGIVDSIILRRETEKVLKLAEKAFAEMDLKYPEFAELRKEHGPGQIETIVCGNLSSALDLTEHLKELEST